jgi:hypothetical protein
VPPFYNEADIVIKITKPGVDVIVEQLLTIDLEGFIELDLTAMPEGFINSYGGQYHISFYEPGNNNPYIFMPTDGKEYEEYDSICLSFATIYSNDDNIVVLNIFG